ncbi:MAG: hypothetical protein RBU37_06615, partial [Myxococcota bacterium]|nr:hypothetical protein [Myxococcota bacterium]
LLAGFLLLALCSWSSVAQAELSLFEGDEVELRAAASWRSASAVLWSPLAELVDDAGALGIAATVTRLELKADFGEDVAFEFHDRLFMRLLSSEAAAFANVGIGVSPMPARSLELSSTLLSKPGLLLDNDLDRLQLKLYFDWVDLTLGRQALTWGDAKLFRVADLWTSFSPFDLDTSEKRGVDALRFLTSVADGRHELELLLVDRASLEDFSGGMRWVGYFDGFDLFAGASKQWDTLVLMTGLNWTIDVWGLRGELAWPCWSFDEEEVELPRLTLGLDYFGSKVFGVLELHFNGAAGAELDLPTPSLQRGETFLLGRYYAGFAVTWEATELLSLSLSTMSNILDPSVLLSPMLSYRLSDEAELLFGASLGIGAEPQLQPTPRLRSEFGSYGQMLSLQLVAYL